MTTHDEPSAESLRAQILAMLEQVTDIPTLLFCSWMINKIVRGEEMPRPHEMKPLQAAFIRMLHAIRDHVKISRDEYALVERYVSAGGLSVARPLAETVRYLREAKRLTRRQVARLSGFPVRWVIALERGQIDDLALDDMGRLGRAFGLDLVAFMQELEKRLDLNAE